ncbi:hypothetical protein KP509_09G093700 [Ceratopteris richardii]|uniref:Uncharacterized protein n=1 Tax=Ceratopteris richardii TaxID=49495 RepID=A0A8T2U6J9_CERRI|nr:hypothetical protein KP509_09G093700 [Ceratopteris richardii]
MHFHRRKRGSFREGLNRKHPARDGFNKLQTSTGYVSSKGSVLTYTRLCGAVLKRVWMHTRDNARGKRDHRHNRVD